MNNFFIIVIDGCGVGELPDAENYGDTGSNTFGNIAKALNGIELPNLQSLGLGNIIPIKGVDEIDNSLASFGKLSEVSKGKDSTSGHWEIGGLPIDFDFPYYPNGFPERIVNKFIELTGIGGILGNKAASGTEIIKELGDEHVKTGFPIIYTSGDSVFQIAAHEDIIPLKRLYEICEITRHKIMIGNDSVGRIIARPFLGTSGNYKRTTNRRDFSINPTGDTILDVLTKNNIQTVAVGKVNDLFNYRGIKVREKTKSNLEGINKIIEYSSKVNNSFIFANLVDFDVYYGHRLDPQGFYGALQEFDNYIPKILEKLDESDALIITADHGNDPTVASTDHTREYTPLLFFRKNKLGKNLGTRKTFSDIGQTVADFFNVENNLKGESFL